MSYIMLLSELLSKMKQESSSSRLKEQKMEIFRLRLCLNFIFGKCAHIPFLLLDTPMINTSY